MPDRTRHPRRRGRFSAPLPLWVAALCVFFAPVLAYAQNASVGLYSDAAGTSCSFSGDAPGLVTAYVIVRPDINGITGVRFSAPIPSCLGATFVSDVVPPNVLSSGSSQTGISLALLACASSATEVLQINYFRTGGTTPCCPYPLAPDPLLTELEASDCMFNALPITSDVARFNADASCACVGNSSPVPPSAPVPGDGWGWVSPSTSFSWFGFDPDGDIEAYDFYLGTDPSPPLHTPNLQEPAHQTTLLPLTQYYWRVVARDSGGREATGPVWTFITRPMNIPPEAPINPSPVDGALNQRRDTNIQWYAADLDGDAFVCDVYFGSTNPPPLLVASHALLAFDPGGLEQLTQYYWRIVVRTPVDGRETSGPVWTFRTEPDNYPPYAPGLQAPPDNAINQPYNVTLRWSAGADPENDPLVYDVYLGTSPSPPLLVTDLSVTTLVTDSLDASTKYYWKVVVRDPAGGSASTAIRNFTVRPENLPPVVPASPTPATGSTNRPPTQTIAWQCSDPDGDAVVYDVYFGTANPPPLVVTGQPAKTYNPGALQLLTTYRWRIVARDSKGAAATGPAWTFVTRANVAPSAPSTPSPAHNASVMTWPTLTWNAADPDGQPVTCDLYFGTVNPPPLLATGLTTFSHATNNLSNNVKYYWRIRVSDGLLSTLGSVWAFTYSENVPPAPPLNPFPADGGASSVIPTLRWTGSDPNGQALTYDVYFGTESPPPLVVSNRTVANYSPGILSGSTAYFWKVVAKDGTFATPGPIWSFATLLPGDADGDGQIAASDAACAMQFYFWNWDCSVDHEIVRADVDCNGSVTPADARCIHKQVLDGSCTFCGGASPAPESVSSAPSVSVVAQFASGNNTVVRLAVSGVASLRSFGMSFNYSHQALLVGVTRRGASANFDVLEIAGFPEYSMSGVSAMVGGYTTSHAPIGQNAEFVDLVFVSSIWGEQVMIHNFVDDLAGAEPVFFVVSAGGGTIPVLISRFDAVAAPGRVDVAWGLQSDEAMESWTLYRRTDGQALPVPIATGRVSATAGTYADTAVEPGNTYHYELLVRSSDGDEVRSQVASATVAALGLALYQNHPNPFNPQTTIRYDVPSGQGAVRVHLLILDVAGRVVRTLVNESQPAGSHSVTWNGTDERGGRVSSGVYFYVLDAGGERITKKLVLLK